ncbi:MAG: hypothetical protein KAT32_02165 [Candidatus Moranbacteria bacterium]|nr:hypothetical protein [Candidatus Moranbacteria bacterium]
MKTFTKTEYFFQQVLLSIKELKKRTFSPGIKVTRFYEKNKCTGISMNFIEINGRHEEIKEIEESIEINCPMKYWECNNAFFNYQGFHNSPNRSYPKFGKTEDGRSWESQLQVPM